MQIRPMHLVFVLVLLAAASGFSADQFPALPADHREMASDIGQISPSRYVQKGSYQLPDPEVQLPSACFGLCGLPSRETMLILIPPATRIGMGVANSQHSGEHGPIEIRGQAKLEFQKEMALIATADPPIHIFANAENLRPYIPADEWEKPILLLMPLSSEGLRKVRRFQEEARECVRLAWPGENDISWRRVLRMASICSVLVILDEDTLQPWFRKNAYKHRWLAGFAGRIGELGGRYGLVALGGLYLLGGRKGQETAMLALAAVFDASVIAGFSKLAFGRSRPDPLDEHADWKPFSGYDSTPSGHSSVAFAMATVLAERYPKHKWLYYCLAASVALARVQSDRHFTSDVFVGSAIGVYSGRRVLANQQRILSWRF